MVQVSRRFVYLLRIPWKIKACRLLQHSSKYDTIAVLASVIAYYLCKWLDGDE